MAGQPDWQWNEMQQIGSDFASVEEVRKWEQFQAEHGDLRARASAVLDRLEIGADATLIDFGCGPGYVALAAAERGAKAWGVDISEAMLDRAAERAAEADLADRVTLVHAGFLTYEHDGPPLDAAVTQAALHHLPDVWKGVALARIADMLMPGGRLFLQDVVFPFGVRQCAQGMDEMQRDFRRQAPTHFAHRLTGHLAKEYSTFDWILEGLLCDAGFAIDSKEPAMLSTYICTRTG